MAMSEAGIEAALAPGLALVFDAARCPDPVPVTVGGQPVRGCEVYIGGSSAFHVWDAAERDRVDHLPKLPVWVPTPGLDNPGHSAMGCLDALRAAGVPPFARPYRAVMVDLETGTADPSRRLSDPAWLAAFRARILAAGYDTMPYASANVVFRYPVYTGRIMACWDGSQQFTCNGEQTVLSIAGKQYVAEVHVPGGFVDLNVFTLAVLPHMGLWTPAVP
jgi:hypothetical protein